MTPPSSHPDLPAMLSRIIDGSITPAEFERLEAILLEDPAARAVYHEHMRVHALLYWRWNREKAKPAGSAWPAVSEPELGIWDSRFPSLGSPNGSPAPRSPDSEPLIPPIAIDTSSTIHYPLFTIHSSLGGWLVSYAAATVITGLAVLGASLYKVSHDYQVAGPARPSSTVVAGPEKPPELVGRITGMADCRWSDPQTTSVRRDVALGQAYSLSSGLMEISYDTGAKVILQGPCTYEVDSLRGGFLSLGKLTARVERSEVRGQRSDPFPLFPLLSPLFSVRTPTAVVTDLGTEFGVEVDKSGATQSHVFRGKIELRAAGAATGDDGGNRGEQVVRLGEDESARVEADRNRIVRVIRGRSGGEAPRTQAEAFIRQMPKWAAIKVFSTGVGLKEGAPDPHWQLAARSDDSQFKPRPAVVSRADPDVWLANDAARSQWISAVGDASPLPDRVTYTFRTTFDLAGTLPSTAALRGRFLADEHVDAIRLNGRKIRVPVHSWNAPFAQWWEFTAAGGFVAGKNVLEIDVFNGDPFAGSRPASPMGCRVELEGLVLGPPAATAADRPVHRWNLDEDPIVPGVTVAADTGGTGGISLAYTGTGGSIYSDTGFRGLPDRGAHFASGMGVCAEKTSVAVPLTYGRNCTVEAYFKFDSLPGTNDVRRVYSEADDTGNKVYMNIDYRNGVIEAGINFTGGWGNATASDANIVAGHWYYVAATFTGTNGNTPSLYLYDKTAGALVGSVTGSAASGSLIGAPAVVAIGNADSANNPGFGGVIENVSVYDRVLDWATILNHATQPPAGKPGE